MVEAFHAMIEDKELYLQCKSNSKLVFEIFHLIKLEQFG